MKNMISRAKADYYVNIINNCCGDQKKLFQIVDKLLDREKKIMLPDYSDAKPMAQIFNEFFVTKIANIRTLLAALENSIDVMLCPPVESLLTPYCVVQGKHKTRLFTEK